MKTPSAAIFLRRSSRRFLVLALLLISAVACQASPAPGVDPQAPAQPAPTATETPTLPTIEPPAPQGTRPPAEEPFPKHTLPVEKEPETGPASLAAQSLETLLALRPLRLQLNVDWADGSMRRYTAEVDGRGNLHLLEESENSPGVYPQMPDIALTRGTRESYWVEGSLYRQDGENAAWTAFPDQPNPLARLLAGSTGPGLWLKLLPEAALNPDGEETVGGFQAEKLTVAGKIDGEEVLGTIWIDKDTRALVKVDLSIPGRLLGDPNAAEPGEMTIKMQVEKAGVGEIMAP